MIEAPRSITFFGSDGCGKSTIAHEYALELERTHAVDVEVIGGASFRDWLTPEISREILGVDINTYEPPESNANKKELYENIAIACYGYARILKDNGTHVVIDSDPYLKRFIWSKIECEDQDYSQYESAFERRVKEHLGDTEFPDVIIGVNTKPEAASQADDYFNRILRRGIVDSYDPTTPSEASKLTDATFEIWNELILKRKYKRLLNAEIIQVLNPLEPNRNIPKKIKSIVKELFLLIRVVEHDE